MALTTHYTNSSYGAPEATLATCNVYLTPAYITWVPAPMSYPVVGTTYLYVDLDKNTTSTSVTCTPSIVDDIRSKSSGNLGQWMGATMDDDCTLRAPYWNANSRTDKFTTAIWPGPQTLMDLGNRIRFFGNDVPGYQSFKTLPSGIPIYYTYSDIIQDVGITSYQIPAVNGSWYTTKQLTFTMPGLSKIFPNVTELSKDCTTVFFETSPNTLTHANFLTQISTLPRTAAQGQVTQPVIPAQTAVPRPQPTPIQVPPSAGPAVQAPSSAPTRAPSPVGGSNNNQHGGSADQPVAPAAPAPRPADNQGQGQPGSPVVVPQEGNNGGNAAAVVTPAPAVPLTTLPALVLPNSQTLQQGSGPATVSDRLIFFDNSGTIYIAPSPTNGAVPDAAKVTSIPLAQLQRQGGVEALGLWLPISGTTVVTPVTGKLTESANGGSDSPGSSSGSNNVESGDPFGGADATPSSGLAGTISKALSNFSAWILSGLGASVAAHDAKAIATQAIAKSAGSGGASRPDASEQPGAVAAASGTVSSTNTSTSAPVPQISSSSSLASTTASISNVAGGGASSTTTPVTGAASSVGAGLSLLGILVGFMAYVL
ncbi:Hypothetical protein D9617_5g068660 [Elsinoe fawcettii]|nr:Hypothetical protein D9617_5g068660 [Elsinoe fawcettii]